MNDIRSALLVIILLAIFLIVIVWLCQMISGVIHARINNISGMVDDGAGPIMPDHADHMRRG
jgi:hypothetical protein